MSFFNRTQKSKDTHIHSYGEFWNWFQCNEKEFYSIVKEQGNVEDGFFDQLSAKLDELKDGFYFLAGMCDEDTAELVLTADGNIRNIAFVEDLVNAAPALPGWRFTALKPALEGIGIEMAGYRYNEDNLHFYAIEHSGYPDEIDITIVHDDLTEENKSQILNGVYIFLDNYLGELDFLINIDNLKVIGRSEATSELIPISKLNDFLKWRQKEFIEKYEGVRHNTKEDSYTSFEAEMENGNMLLAIINTDILKWDCKASHPWVSVFTIKYDGSDTNGMPHSNDYETMDDIEDEIVQKLNDADGYLNIGRQTGNSEREVYFACKDFRLPSKVFYEMQQKFKDKFEIEFDIYKDKYWQSFERFNRN